MNRFKLEEREIPPDMASWLDEVKADIVELKNSLGKLQIKVGKIDGSLDVLTAAKKPPHPWVTSAISFVGMALLGFWGWMAVTLVQHGNTLAGIRQSMLSLGITVAASSPLTPRSQNQATTALSEARKSSTTIPPSVIEQAGKSFIEAAPTDSKAWDVALDFLAYRTVSNAQLLAVGTAEQIATTRVDPKLTTYYVYKSVPGREPTMTTGGDVPIEKAATIHMLTEPGPHEGPRGKQVILVEGGTILLDDTIMKHVVIRNSVVYYTGHRTQLKDVIFVNCTFAFRNEAGARNLAAAVLMQPSVTFAL